MAGKADILRPWHCYSRPAEESIQQSLGNELYQGNYLPFIQVLSGTISLHNDFSSLRRFIGNVLTDLNAQGQHELGRSAIFYLAYLQEYVTQFGLLSSEEVRAIQYGERLIERDGAEKYIPQVELKSLADAWHTEGKVIGLVHGSFDPPHIAHARLFADVSQYCDVLLVGVDADEVLRERKGKDRPRFPLAARVWDIGVLPSVDGVFVLPVKDNSDAAFEQLYRDLHIGILGSAGDNLYRDTFEERMRRLGGAYIPGFSESVYSSTTHTTLLGESSAARELGFDLKSVQEQFRSLDDMARRKGVLRDLEVNS